MPHGYGSDQQGLWFTPPVLFYEYVQSFTTTATADSAFIIFTLGALFCAALAVVLLLVAPLTLFFRPARAFGLGYLSGLVAGLVLRRVFDALEQVGSADTEQIPDQYQTYYARMLLPR